MNENVRPVETTGQQRAAARLQAILAANADRYANAPADKVTRQQRRRSVHKRAKRMRARVQAIAVRGELAGLRERRIAVVDQGPGRMTMIGRPYEKPRGQADWRSRPMNTLLDGRAVPAGCEARLHTTKGPRVTRA